METFDFDHGAVKAQASFTLSKGGEPTIHAIVDGENRPVELSDEDRETLVLDILASRAMEDA